MDISNLLSQSLIDFTVDGISSNGLNWIGKIISWIFNLFSNFYGAVAIGVIVFTLLLKTVVLPLDIYSRVKTKKQSLLMEKMRPQMEKLQKQYANDKQMYNQKVVELQRANGYNPLGACLPMIISLVIFMVVFSSFSTYSNYAMINTYNNLVNAYNDSVAVYVKVDGEADNNEHFLEKVEQDGHTYYYVDFDKFQAYYTSVKEKNEDIGDSMKSCDDSEVVAKFVETGSFDVESNEFDKKQIVAAFVHVNARASSAKWYRENKKSNSFGWIGNLWYPDSMLNKEVPKFSKFKSSISRAVGSMSSTYEESYNEVTYNLSLPDPAHPDRKPETKKYNGYFVLILLAIGLMLVQQFIMMRSQKAANELSSVDGSAARTNKIMMVAMPLIYGMFSFFYSAAFSIYMIVNTGYSLISTVIINKIVSVRFAKKEMEASVKGNRAPKRKRLK